MPDFISVFTQLQKIYETVEFYNATRLETHPPILFHIKFNMADVLYSIGLITIFQRTFVDIACCTNWSGF